MYDVGIIGGGPAGYLAAERLGQKGKKVLLIEKNYLGGTCLNVGCIPTKTLLNGAKQLVHAHEGAKFGLRIEGVSFDWEAMQKWKGEVVEKLRRGIAAQMKQFGIMVAEGTGEILSPPKGTSPALIRVTGASGVNEFSCKTILVCPGSTPIAPSIPGTDNPAVLDSTALLSIPKPPERLVVIGGGVIGIEFASLFSALGSTVTVIEMMDEIIPFMDAEQAPLLRRAMKETEFKLGCKVLSIEPIQKGKAAVRYADKAGTEARAEADMVLMAVGRKPVLSSWGAEGAGVDIHKGAVVVDDKMRTNIPGLWAAGDITGRSLLAHSAYRMAEVAVSDIVQYLDRAEGQTRPGHTGESDAAHGKRMRYNAIPWAVYGIPEAAGVGMTEQEALAAGISIRKASLPMRLSGRFAAENGFAALGAVKVIVEAGSEKILGIHAIGAYASEFIWGGAALIEQEFRVADVKELILPHPTVCELIRDVVWSLEE